MNGLALCAGVGGLELGLRLAFGPTYRTVCYVEREVYCAEILARRMEEGYLDLAPIWDDLATFDGRPWRGAVDIISAGLPCQPYSLAGSRHGHDDERAVWPAWVRIVRECEPAHVFLENVPPFLKHFEPVYDELLGMGFELPPPALYTAAECGAPHIRRRLFITATHPERLAVRDEHGGRSGSDGRRSPGVGDARQAASNTTRGRAPRRRPESTHEQPGQVGCEPTDAHSGGFEKQRGSWLLNSERETLAHRCGSGCSTCRTPWATESPVLRVADGPAHRVDELRAIGNGVVPEMVRRALTCN